MIYLWLKAFHIIFVFAWIAGLLIYPRYKIHQMTSQPGEPLFEKMRESALLLRRIILAPSIIAVWVLGLSLIFVAPEFMNSIWFWVKMVLVLGVSGMHGALISFGKKVDLGEQGLPTKKLRLASEVPFILFAIITILVVLKPF